MLLVVAAGGLLARGARRHATVARRRGRGAGPKCALGYVPLRYTRPIGVVTTSAGKPLDVRETVMLNTDIFNNAYFYDLQSSMDNERIPDRIVHARGAGAYGYFEVTHDVSKYTKAEVFNGIGKRTPLVARFSVQFQSSGGSDIVREVNAMVIKFYTKEGNLDLLGLSTPMYTYRDPMIFTNGVHAFRRNPKTNIVDTTSIFDMITKHVDILFSMLWLFSDLGIPNGYRKMDSFPVHAFEINNKHGDSYFVRFNIRSELGVEVLTSEAARRLRSRDPDYSIRDLYNAIATGNFPSWRLEMDVLSPEDLTKLNYNPFDVTRLWENGTYHTVTIGRVVLNRNPDNFFKDIQKAAYNPGNLVPGIPGPHDLMFKARRFAYRDAQNYRLGINHNNIQVNHPKYTKLYNRDGIPPVLDNMKDAPNYYQNSFNGPVPFVDSVRPKKSLIIYDRNAVDLQPLADFYNTFVTSEGHRNRMAANIAELLVVAVEKIQNRTIQLLYQVDSDLGRRSELALAAARAALPLQRPVFVPVEQTPEFTTVDVLTPAS